MSAFGRWCAVSAATLGLITVGMSSRDSSDVVVGADDGARLFVAKGCASCHAGPDPSPHVAAGFPSLANVAEWAGDRRPGLTAAEYLTESIVAPNAFISPGFQPGRSGPTREMPRLQLDGDEVDALVDYLLRGPISS